MREGTDAVNRRDLDAFLALSLRPMLSGRRTPSFRDFERSIAGRAEVREWFEEALLELWESFHVDHEEITELSG